ncbi:DUF4124 domain-containing protein [Paraferrimonas sp. SM1919]|uniref:DUF4124 domain-containing protein n=1 Tax=Paraferrimonas sp. SM1919 TaxID=2662263 RepID=UPI0013D0778B|nr:DUF4124 domain-containing protein [Paraferrimonas sp. SM1919]
MLRILILLVTLGFLTQLDANQIYFWRDTNGVAHYSDTKPVGIEAQQIELSKLNTNEFKINPINTPSEPTVANNKQLQINISTPTDQQTIRNNNGNFLIVAELYQPLEFNQKIQLVIDGSNYGKALASSSFNVTNLDRGSHTIKLQLIDKNGKVIASSKQITVYLHRAHL